jgi:antitoxin (DNA-binding transcriptional repressor) of toxin-antitoxin stability system
MARRQARAQDRSLVDRAARGERIAITRCGKLAAIMGPAIGSRVDLRQVVGEIEKIRKRAKKVSGVSAKSLIVKKAGCEGIRPGCLRCSRLVGDDPVPLVGVKSREVISQGSKANVTGLCVLEMANGLAMAECRGKLDADDIEEGCQHQLEIMLADTIEVFSEWIILREALYSARTHKLCPYDGLYREMARRERLPLAKLNNTLRAAEQSPGVQLVT